MFLSSVLKPRIPFFLLIAFVLMLGDAAAAAGRLAEFGRSCETAAPVELDTAVEVLSDRLADTTFYRIEVPEAGVLVPEISSTLQSIATAAVELLGADCRPPHAQDVAYVTSSHGPSAIRMHAPGIYHIRLMTGAENEGDRYDLTLGFSRAVRLRETTSTPSVDEWEEDDEGFTIGPETVALRWSRSPADKVDEWEEDDEGLVAGDPASCSALRKDAGEVLLTVDESGILTLDAAGAALFAEIDPLDPGPRATSGTTVPMGPSRDFSVWIDRGTYRLQWTVAGGDVALCGPRIGFFPV